MFEVIQAGIAVETGAGRDEANPAGMRVHKMKKEADVERENSLCRSSGPGEKLLRSEHVCDPYYQTKQYRKSCLTPLNR